VWRLRRCDPLTAVIRRSIEARARSTPRAGCRSVSATPAGHRRTYISTGSLCLIAPSACSPAGCPPRTSSGGSARAGLDLGRACLRAPAFDRSRAHVVGFWGSGVLGFRCSGVRCSGVRCLAHAIPIACPLVQTAINVAPIRIRPSANPAQRPSTQPRESTARTHGQADAPMTGRFINMGVLSPESAQRRSRPSGIRQRAEARRR
jgi:hypothetical protein